MNDDTEPIADPVMVRYVLDAYVFVNATSIEEAHRLFDIWQMGMNGGDADINVEIFDAYGTYDLETEEELRPVH